MAQCAIPQGLILAASLLVLAPLPAVASACPVCDRDTGVQVRAGIFDENFGFNLAMTALPFGLFLAITAVIHFGVPRRSESLYDMRRTK